MAGVDRESGRVLDGWPHVVQSVNVIMTTRLGERVMRRHFGSSAFSLLGRLLTADHIVRFFSVYCLAVELWEPRFKIVRVIPIRTGVDDIRLGRFAFAVEGEYRPRGHLGDPTPEGVRRVGFAQSEASLIGVSA
ncbi:GPW/gp25 family protein [Bosea sp. (in: a-proteobacteria)]